MRKLTPVWLFLVVFVVTQLTQPYTLYQLESDNLFLTTPDYAREVFGESLGLYNYLASFFMQFCAIPYLGAVLVALWIVGIYGLANELFRPLAILGACVAWCVLAYTMDWCLLMQILVYLSLACVIRMLITKRNLRLPTAWHWVSAIACLFVSSLWIWHNPKVRDMESWNAVEHAAIHHDWDRVLRLATPQATAKDRRLLPYAVLAMNARGELGKRLFQYPLNGPEDFDMSSWKSYEGYQFNALLYACLGSQNEAMHNLMQAAVYLPRGMSFGILRQLVWCCQRNGNEVIADKYRAILAHSVLHAKWSHQPVISQLPPRGIDASRSAHAGIVTSHLGLNLSTMLQEGNQSAQVLELYLCWCLASRDLEKFSNLISLGKGNMKALPRYYQEALVVAGTQAGLVSLDGFPISAEVSRQFQQFCQLMNSRDLSAVRRDFAHSYWAYYFSILPMSQQGMD